MVAESSATDSDNNSKSVGGASLPRRYSSTDVITARLPKDGDLSRNQSHMASEELEEWLSFIYVAFVQFPLDEMCHVRFKQFYICMHV